MGLDFLGSVRRRLSLGFSRVEVDAGLRARSYLPPNLLGSGTRSEKVASTARLGGHKRAAVTATPPATESGAPAFQRDTSVPSANETVPGEIETAARKLLADELNVDEGDLKLDSAEGMGWSDACLGRHLTAKSTSNHPTTVVDRFGCRVASCSKGHTLCHNARTTNRFKPAAAFPWRRRVVARRTRSRLTPA